MAGGPIFPCSAVPVTAGRVFPHIYTGGTNSKLEDTLGVEASVGADATWSLRFQMPPSLPTGTGKLRLLALANATSGAAKVNAKWASVAAEETPDIAAGSLNAEGTGTVTWSTGDADVYKELKITLDADTLVAGEVVAMDLVFETTSWTLAVVSGWSASIIWE